MLAFLSKYIFVFILILYVFGACQNEKTREAQIHQNEQKIDSILQVYIGKGKAVIINEYLYLNLLTQENDFYSKSKLNIIRDLAIIKIKPFLEYVKTIIIIQYSENKLSAFFPEKTIYSKHDAKDIISLHEKNTILYNYKFYLMKNFDGKKLEALWGVIAAINKRNGNKAFTIDFIELIINYANETMHGIKYGEYKELLVQVKELAYSKNMVAGTYTDDFDYFLKYNQPQHQTIPYLLKQYRSIEFIE